MVPPMNRPYAVRPHGARPFSALAALIALAAIANAVFVGCGGKPQQSTENQPSPPAGSTTSANPGGTAPAGDLGAKVYTERCVLCHGPQGRGDGVAAAGLNPKPRNHTDGAYMNKRTDAELLEVIRKGKGAMPPWGSVLSEAEIQAVLKHVRSLAQPPYPGSS